MFAILSTKVQQFPLAVAGPPFHTCSYNDFTPRYAPDIIKVFAHLIYDGCIRTKHCMTADKHVLYTQQGL